jgi:hypothetical protein
MRGFVRANGARRGERGSTLFIVASALTVLLGIGALAIDIASLYVARNESQRAADAGALAGAKVFVESGCVTTGDCTAEEGTATDRATQVALQNLVAGQAVTVSGVTFTERSQNPQITVQIQSPRLPVFFAGAVGITSGRTVGATATAEAYNPSGQSSGQRFCTACVRPWLIPNCDPSYAGPSQCLLNPGGDHPVENPACPGVIGEGLQIAIETQPTRFLAVDDGTGFTGYQKSIVTCNTGQMTCGSVVHTLPFSQIAFPTPGIGTLLHIAAGNTGLNQGQDWIDPTVCPPQIHAGASNPLVIQGVIGQDALVATSDSIVTAYLYDNSGGPPPNPNVSRSVTVLGFAQIFVTQQDQNGDVWGVILGLAGCATSDTDCDPGAFQGSTMLPVRLITPAGS